MSKFRFDSIVGIVFVYLFFINVVLFIIALFTASIGIAGGAVFLCLFQYFLYYNFKNRQLLLRNYQLRETLKSFNSLKFKVLVRNRSNQVNKYKQRKLINDRATNSRSFLAVGSFSNPGYMEYERIRCKEKVVCVDRNSLVVTIGTAQCARPYSSSILNIGAISYESVSKTALFALAEGAKIGGFSINTGEAGISPYHIRGGGDLIWQIGPHYNGCSNADGSFNEQLFKKNATRLYVKMIEISLCSDLKGEGAEDRVEFMHSSGMQQLDRGVPQMGHSAFGNENGLMCFASKLRVLSGGKPIGVKTCISDKREFEELCLAMQGTGVYLDFITIEGGQVGRYSEMSLLEAIAFARKMLNKYRLPSKIIASGDIITEYDILRAIALGASVCYSTRGMLLSLKENESVKRGFNPLASWLTCYKKKGNADLELEMNRVRVARFHKNTTEAVAELMKLCGYETLSDVQAKDFYRRTNTLRTRTLEDIYFKDATKYGDQQNLLPA